MSEAHIQDLADEVLLLIFQYLPDQALLSARCVCAQWKAVAEDPSLLEKSEAFYRPNRLHVCVLGLPASGKSTLIGRICARYSPRIRRSVEDYQRQGAVNPWSWVVDTRPEERRKERTIGMQHAEVNFSFSTAVTFWNISGQRSGIEHAYRVASMSDVAFLVIPANEQVYLKENHAILKPAEERVKPLKDSWNYYLNEGGGATMGILNEQLFLAKTAGVNRVIVAINCMDSNPPEAGQRVFESIRDHILSSGLLKKAGFTSDPSLIVPCSALQNLNLVEKGGFDWFKGPSVMEALDPLCTKQYRYVLKDRKTLAAKGEPFTMSIHETFKLCGIGTVLCGRVDSGMLDTTSPNLDSLTLQKTTNLWENTETSKFRTIASNGIKLKVAKPGDYVGISIPGWAVRDVRRGQVVFAPPLNFTGKPADYHIAAVDKFEVFVRGMAQLRHQLNPGMILFALVRCNHFRCQINSLQITDKNRKPISEKEEKPARRNRKYSSNLPVGLPRDYLILELEIQCCLQIILPFDRIALRDNKALLAIGQVTKGAQPK